MTGRPGTEPRCGRPPHAPLLDTDPGPHGSDGAACLSGAGTVPGSLLPEPQSARLCLLWLLPQLCPRHLVPGPGGHLGPPWVLGRHVGSLLCASGPLGLVCPGAASEVCRVWGLPGIGRCPCPRLKIPCRDRPPCPRPSVKKPQRFRGGCAVVVRPANAKRHEVWARGDPASSSLLAADLTAGPGSMDRVAGSGLLGSAVSVTAGQVVSGVQTLSWRGLRHPWSCLGDATPTRPWGHVPEDAPSVNICSTQGSWFFSFNFLRSFFFM